MRVLVTGGAGYVGGAVTEALIEDGHAPVVYDSLVSGRGSPEIPPGVPLVRADLTDRRALSQALREHRIEAVIHMAAYSIVPESMEDPGKYYRNNVTAGLVLLDAMVEMDVNRLVFSSSAAVYGEPEKQPIEETDPTVPTSPYGETKLAFERALAWYERAHALEHVSLRYFNAAGATARTGERHEPETHLIPIVLEAAAGLRPAVGVNGTDYPTRDGTCVRDYVHVADLARAHTLALTALGREGRSRVYNLGCGGEGYTVFQVLAAARAVTGREVVVRTGPRRPGDPAVLVASSDRIRRELGWRPECTSLEELVESAWSWMRTHGTTQPA